VKLDNFLSSFLAEAGDVSYTTSSSPSTPLSFTLESEDNASVRQKELLHVVPSWSSTLYPLDAIVGKLGELEVSLLEGEDANNKDRSIGGRSVFPKDGLF
jgi:hypothetical protein